MKQEMKTYLQEAFSAPEPVRKESFLKSAIPTQISTFDFVKTQISYIRKRVWVVAVLILALAIMCAYYVEKESIWMISAMVPFIALCAVTESVRSATYGMSELEMSAMFSLKSVTLARLVSIGALHLIILCALIPLTGGVVSLSVIKKGIYLVVPYLLTSVLGLVAVRKVYDKEAIYLCGGISVMVSLLYIWARVFLPWIYEEKYFIWWCVLVMYLFIKMWSECKKVIYQTEELSWN